MKAIDFIDALSKFKQKRMAGRIGKFFKGNDGKTKDFGVAFGDVLRLAKTCKSMSLSKVNRLLDSDCYQVLMGADSIIDFKARDRKVGIDALPKYAPPIPEFLDPPTLSTVSFEK